MRFRLSFLISILLHLILLKALWINDQDSLNDPNFLVPSLKNNMNTEIVEVEILDDENDKDLKKKEKDKETIKSASKPKQEPNSCKEFYIGIGVITSFVLIEYEGETINANQIVQVYEGYPAHAAGILVSDIIIPKEPIKDGGPIGSPVDLVLIRDGLARKMTLYRDKICLRLVDE